MRVYVATTNSDTTEGRGREIDISYWDNETHAYEACKGKGVQGSDGSVYLIQTKEEYTPWPPEPGRLMAPKPDKRTLLYGWHKTAEGRYGNGWVDGRDNPEYKEYLRLKEIYGKEIDGFSP